VSRQFIRIRDNENTGNLAAIVELKRDYIGKLVPVIYQRPRFAIDLGEFGSQTGGCAFLCQAGKEAGHAVRSKDAIHRSRGMAAAVGMQHHVLPQQCQQLRRIAGSARAQKVPQHFAVAGAIHGKTRSMFPDALTCPRHDLPAICFAGFENRSQFVIRSLEYFPEQKSHALRWR
jgi:hypothetical protein